MIQSPQFTQDVPTGFQVTSPPVLAGNEDQVGILHRGILLTDVDMEDLSVQQSIVYTGMVGTMLAESHAAQDTEVGNCDVE